MSGVVLPFAWQKPGQLPPSLLVGSLAKQDYKSEVLTHEACSTQACSFNTTFDFFPQKSHISQNGANNGLFNGLMWLILELSKTLRFFRAGFVNMKYKVLVQKVNWKKMLKTIPEKLFPISASLAKETNGSCSDKRRYFCMPWNFLMPTANRKKPFKIKEIACMSLLSPVRMWTIWEKLTLKRFLFLFCRKNSTKFSQMSAFYISFNC